jgi:P27 family predicted phage terminase small subunit
VRGRKAKPTVLKILEGNPGKRPLNAEEPRPRRCIPRRPDHLDILATKEWKRITRELDLAGLLTDCDRAVVAAYCQCWSRWVKAERMVQQTGEVLKGEAGYYQNPYLAVANRALDQMQRLAAQLGLDPTSRSRLRVEAREGPPIVLSRRREA